MAAWAIACANHWGCVSPLAWASEAVFLFFLFVWFVWFVLFFSGEEGKKEMMKEWSFLFKFLKKRLFSPPK